VLPGINVLVTSVGHSFIPADISSPATLTDYIIDSAYMFGSLRDFPSLQHVPLLKLSCARRRHAAAQDRSQLE
jgi:hypothetical protein